MTKQYGVGIIVSRTDYKGRNYIGPLVARRDIPRKGWFLWGNSQDAWQNTGGIFRVCAWPDQPGRRGQLQGWRTKADAEAWAQKINEGPATGYRCTPFREHGLWQARGFDAFGRHFNRAFVRSDHLNSFLSAMRRGDNRVERY